MPYFEDLSVGDRFETGTFSMTTEEIVAFARDFDPQPFHLGEEEAVGTFFGRLVASGWHTGAVTMRLLVESGTFPEGIVGASGELVWPRPTFPGDTLRVRGEITELLPSPSRPERGMVTVLCETVNQRSEVVQRMKTRILVLRRPGS